MVARGARVALLFDSAHWTDYAVAYLGVRKAGAVAVPLLAGLGDLEIARIVRDCGASAILASPALAPGCTSVPILDSGELEQQAGADPIVPPLLEAEPGEILYRSRPLARPMLLLGGPSDYYVAPPPLLHSFPPGTLAAQEALRGCLAVTAPGSVVLPAFEADRMCALIEATPERACGLHLVTAQALLDSGATQRHDVSRLSCLVLVGAHVAPALAGRLTAAFPRARLLLIDRPGEPGRHSASARRPQTASVAPAALDSVAPVAFSQEGMLWHELFAPGCQNLPGLARRYRGRLDVAALSRALDEIVRRHGTLRTGFELRDGRPVQVVRTHRPFELPLRDLTGLAAVEREEEVGRTVAEAGRRPFDLAVDSLFVPELLRLGEEDHVLVIRTHHSVFDDWSVGVFRRQLAKLYAAYAAGEPSPLPDPALQFTDFCRRQRSDLAGPAGTGELAYWRRELADAPLTVQLPVDDPSAPAGSPQRGGETVSVVLDPGLHEQLRELARHERATVFMTMLAAFGVLVARYTGQEDLVIATVVANRNRTELEGLIGCFTKKVPLRLRLHGDPTFSQALARTRSALLGALSHQDLPFEAVLQDVLGSAAPAHGLVPHVVLVFQGVTPSQELLLEGMESAGLDNAGRAGRAHFMASGTGATGELAPLPWGAGLYAGTFVILSVDESGLELSCTARGAFHTSAVREVMEGFATLLIDVAAHPTRRISELAVLDSPAAAAVLERGRGPDPPPADTLARALRAQVDRDPAALAVSSSGERITYAELDDRSERLAQRLRALGAKPGDRVGTALESSPELIVAVLATWKVGAAWVGLDPNDASERRRRIGGDTSLGLIVGPEGAELRITAPAGAAPAVSFASSSATSPRLLEEAAVVFYGSGSSAVEPGVVLDRGSVLNLLAGLRLLDTGERRVCLCPRPTDDAFVRRLVALLDGHALHIPRAPLSADPVRALRLLAAGDVDLVDGTPDELRSLLDAGLSQGLPEGIEAILVVGTRAGVAPELWRALRALPGVRPHVLYGPPECGFAATAAVSGVRGVGRPLAGMAVRVLDAQGRPVPLRAIGELTVGGPSLARGYLGDPEATRGRFAEWGGERLFRTGELARLLPDGTVELVGPANGDLDLRGFRVEPARIAAALDGCPGLRDVEVLLERDEHGEHCLVVHAVADGTPPSLARLRAYLWSRLPGYAWPTRLILSEPGPPTVPRDAAEAEPQAAAESPPEEETILRALWGEGRGQLGPEANYWQDFSFLDALARAREVGLHVPVEDVMRNRTIGTLASAIAARRSPPSQPPGDPGP